MTSRQLPEWRPREGPEVVSHQILGDVRSSGWHHSSSVGSSPHGHCQHEGTTSPAFLPLVFTAAKDNSPPTSVCYIR